jgi:polar amino acid transport system substrate-binding protein
MYERPFKDAMKQLTQQLKDGTMQVLEVPEPALMPGHLLIRNHFSVISAGTEGKTVNDARLGYIGKAKARKDEVGKVIKIAQDQGLKKTYDMVMNKLDALSPLGYSSAGEVVAVGEGVSGFAPGDFVACGGSGAVHAEVVCVPKNLCAPLKNHALVKEGAFTTIGAIAMQGVRQAELNLGESCVVIGLGLIGQLTVQFLNASGVRAIGVDIDPRAVAQAKESGAYLALERNADGVEDAIEQATDGIGADAIIITAGTSSLDPVEFAGKIARKKAKVVIVGAVPTGFSRKNYYVKELDLRMSSSYGPGRYDSNYEEKGIDYPVGYVRWTENRNMKAYLDLLHQGKIKLNHLITHEFSIDQAKDAYDMIHAKSEAFTGIVLTYDVKTPLKQTPFIGKQRKPKDVLGVAFVGAGSFAQNMLLPNLKLKGVGKTGVVTARGNTSLNVKERFGFAYAATDPSAVWKDEATDAVFIATRHDLHAGMTLQALKANKHVFVEKPLCLKEDEMPAIFEALEQSQGKLMLGFNRRFAPLVNQLKKALNESSPKAIHYRINAGVLPADHWVHDPKVGGGRIIGEACHFIDLCAYLAGSAVETVSAQALGDAKQLGDSMSIQLRFVNGSIASIDYLSNGSKALSKEFIEVFSGGVVYQIDDFKTLTKMATKKSVIKGSGQDKGHGSEVAAFVQALQSGTELPISPASIYNSMSATFKAVTSASEGGTLQQL